MIDYVHGVQIPFFEEYEKDLAFVGQGEWQLFRHYEVL